MSSSVGSTQATVRPGETAQATIQLQGGPVIAKAFVIHFARDSAFIEPPMRPVLRQVADYAAAHPKEKLLIVGHTDLTGSSEYNQSLSERRARSAYAFLTCGEEDTAALNAIDDWDLLRQKRQMGDIASWNDGWDVQEYQWILQDAGYYIGPIDNVHGQQTTKSVKCFQQDYGLQGSGIVNDDTWRTLLGVYLSKEEGWPRLPLSQFVRAWGSGIELKWLGCGEQDPIKNIQGAWRPNRRVECLFVPYDAMPCAVPKPMNRDTDLDNITSWSADETRACFAIRSPEALLRQPTKWLIQYELMVQRGVSGRLVCFADGALKSLPSTKFALIAPDGEYLHVDVKGQADIGERSQGARSSDSIWTKTDGDGFYFFPHEKQTGVYQLIIANIDYPQIVRFSSSVLSLTRGVGGIVYADFGARITDLSVTPSNHNDDREPTEYDA